MTYRLGICCSILLSYGTVNLLLSDDGAQMKHLMGLIGAILITACGAGDSLDVLQRGEEARVVRILDGDTLALSTGLVVKLASLEAPSFGRGERQDAIHAKESARILENLVMGRQVRLYYPGLTRDRYDRAIAHVKTIDQLGAEYWVNHEVARRGGAHVRIYPDTDILGEELLQAEADARIERSGLWSKRAYFDHSAIAVSSDFRGFTVIKGKTFGSAGPGGAYAACRISIEGAAMLLEFDEEAKTLCSLKSGTQFRARGYMREGRMEITHPLNFTVIDQSS